MCRKNRLLLLLTLVCLIFGLLAMMAPFSDIDGDGLLDSLMTEGFVLLPVLYVMAGLLFLLDRFASAYLPAPRPHSSFLFSPPIMSTK
jgi:hypothetical protein